MLTGKDVHNTANISGDEIYFENNIKHSANDSKTIKVNDPKIDIQKSVDKLEYKVRRCCNIYCKDKKFSSRYNYKQCKYKRNDTKRIRLKRRLWKDKY